MNTFAQQCVSLRRKDHTLNEIMDITGRPKTSVWFHIRDIPLSNKKQQQVTQIATKRILSYSKKRKGVSARKFRKFSAWSKHTVFLVAHLLFDGEIRQSGCAYHNRCHKLIQHFERCMKKIYDFKPKQYLDKKSGVRRLSYYNVALARYLKGKQVELLKEIGQLPKPLKREFLRAFFDDEGCIDYKPGGKIRRVRGYQKNKQLLVLVQQLLQNFYIESFFAKSYVHEIVISGKENLILFQKEINFSKEVCVNGKRKNSVWKENLEKREILRRAINSYQI